MTSTGFYISKLDASKRQLRAAINLFITQEDQVSCHTLACAAYEILEVLAKAKGTKSAREQAIEMVDPKYKDEVYKSIHAAENFFKHSKSDRNETIEFDPSSTEVIIWDAANLYKEITSEIDGLFAAFNLWMQAEYPEVFILNSDMARLHKDFFSRYDHKNRSLFFKEMMEFAQKRRQVHKF